MFEALTAALKRGDEVRLPSFGVFDVKETAARMARNPQTKEEVASGVRNTVGFDFHPISKELWFTDNGRDWLGDDSPPDELNRLTKVLDDRREDISEEKKKPSGGGKKKNKD